MRCILQVLAVLHSSLYQGGAQRTHIFIYVRVERLVSPPKVEPQREDSSGTVWWVCRRPSVREDVGLERIKVDNQQQVLVVFAKPVTPGLLALASIVDEEVIARGTPQ
jgi:hypothetical protein